MKKLITLTLLSLITMAVFAQTPIVTPSHDTAFLVFKQATLQKSMFVTTANSAVYTPEVFSPASYTITFKPYIPGTTPPVTPPVIPPTTQSAPIYPSQLKVTASAVVNWTGKSNQTISGLSISGGSSPCITLNNCDHIHITLNNLKNSTSQNGGIYLVNCHDILIDYNVIENVATGVYVTDSPNGNNIVINYNRFHNMQGPFPRGQFVQLNTVNGSGISISYNRGDNVMGSSHPEDAINVYKSNGTAASPIQVVGNWINGGGPSTTGGGIMLGDNGGKYQYAANNVLDNPGQYGMAIAGGDHNTITGNTIYAVKQSFTNIAIYIWGQGGFAVTNATVSNNIATWYNGTDPTLSGGLNGYWDAAGTAANVNNNWNAGLTAAVLPPVNTW